MMQRILLVEDDVWLQEMYADELVGIEVLRAGTADEALSILDSENVDLIVLDMFLPDHNGIELIHEISSYQDTANTPVIVLSAVAPHDFGLTAKRLSHYNIVEYLYKPEVKPREVAEKIQLHLKEYVNASR